MCLNLMLHVRSHIACPRAKITFGTLHAAKHILVAVAGASRRSSSGSSSSSCSCSSKSNANGSNRYTSCHIPHAPNPITQTFLIVLAVEVLAVEGTEVVVEVKQVVMVMAVEVVVVVVVAVVMID